MSDISREELEALGVVFTPMAGGFSVDAPDGRRLGWTSKGIEDAIELAKRHMPFMPSDKQRIATLTEMNAKLEKRLDVVLMYAREWLSLYTDYGAISGDANNKLLAAVEYMEEIRDYADTTCDPEPNKLST